MPPAMHRHALPAAGFLAACARRIHAARLRGAGAEPAALARCTVVLPSLAAAGDFAAAWREASASPAALLPRLTTLQAWASGVPLARGVLSAAAREAQLYEALSHRRWFGQADRWAVAAELGALFDALTRARVRLPDALQDFTRHIAAAYGAGEGAQAVHAGGPLSFEARVVHDLWRAYGEAGAAGGPLDPESAYALRLSILADRAGEAVYVLGADQARLSPAEADFFERCAQRAEVTLFSVDTAAGDPLDRALRAAWPAAADEHLPARALRLRETAPESPLAGRVRIAALPGLEAEARAIDFQVRAWLQAGHRSIAVVVLDRVVARRARALLERAQVLVEDEAGWALSTTSAATAVGRLLDVVTGDGYHRELLDLMKSPFVFHDVPRAARRMAVARFERLLRRAGLAGGVNDLLALAGRDGDGETRAMLERVASACRAFGRKRDSLAGWLASLRAALSALGIDRGFAGDAAGAQVLETLDALACELHGETLTVSLTEWRRWLMRRVENATFRDPAIASPVTYTPLAGTRLRRYDAVIIAGADAAHLPGPAPHARFFNQGVRRELGLPLHEQALQEMRADLASLIGGAGETLITWRATAQGEPNLLSPWVQALDTLHECAWGTRLEDDGLDRRARAAQVEAGRQPPPLPLPSLSARPAPAVPRPLLPAALTASAYQDLVDCPYRFHVRHLLGLKEADEVSEALQKSDYGSHVHQVLHELHLAHPIVSALAPAAAAQALERVSERVFREALGANYLDRAWLARWKKLIPAYIEWQSAREAAGWRYAQGELQRELKLATPGGHSIVLRGRLDRVDTRDGCGHALVDYKTLARDRLKRVLQAPGEDVQLAVYALLWGAPVEEAFYLALDGEAIHAVPAPHEADAVAGRLVRLVDELRAGAPLPAQGDEAVCAHCEAYGLCRRPYWK